MQETQLQAWIIGLNKREYAVFVGLLIGVMGGLIGLLVTLLGPVIAFGLFVGVMVGLAVISHLQVALYGIIAVMILIPFGTSPIKVGFTPTFMDAAIGTFLLVYLMQWMKRRRSDLRWTPVHGLLLIYLLWLLLAFALGMRHSPPTARILRQFMATLLSLGLVFIVVDILRDPQLLRGLVVVVILFVGVQALIALGLYVLPDDTAEVILNRLWRIGYPAGGVIRYLESNPALPERAIGTWVDPNSLGGLLAIASVMIAPQVFASRPVLRYRSLTVFVLGVVIATLILTFSRASVLAFGSGMFVITVLRYRRYLFVLLFGLVLLLALPQAQGYLERFIDAFTAGDLATQMRIGEYTDSFRLIQRYPIFGVGFTGTPDIDIYTDVASMYLIMANQIGLGGLTIYLMTQAGLFAYGLYAWQFARKDDDLDAIHLGFHAAVVAGMVNAVADLYFFRLEYQGPITLFWMTVTLALASSRLAIERRQAGELTIASGADVR